MKNVGLTELVTTTERNRYTRETWAGRLAWKLRWKSKFLSTKLYKLHNWLMKKRRKRNDR